MRRRELIFGFLAAAARARAAGGFPQTEETLRYTINWPSGLSLGEAQLHAKKTAIGWDFDLTLDAAVPGFAVSDRYQSSVNADLCALAFEKTTSHGARKAHERTEFDYGRGVAKRSTANGGGSTDIPLTGCSHDALDYIFLVRRELAQGRVPPPQTVLFGGPYQVRLDFTGAQTLSVNEQREQADRLAVTTKGPSSSLNFEIFFARDAVRAPLAVRVPLSLGTFSMELVR